MPSSKDGNKGGSSNKTTQACRQFCDQEHLKQPTQCKGFQGGSGRNHILTGAREGAVPGVGATADNKGARPDRGEVLGAAAGVSCRGALDSGAGAGGVPDPGARVGAGKGVLMRWSGAGAGVRGLLLGAGAGAVELRDPGAGAGAGGLV